MAKGAANPKESRDAHIRRLTMKTTTHRNALIENSPGVSAGERGEAVRECWTRRHGTEKTIVSAAEMWGSMIYLTKLAGTKSLQACKDYMVEMKYIKPVPGRDQYWINCDPVKNIQMVPKNYDDDLMQI